MFIMVDSYVYAGRNAFGGAPEYEVVRAAINPSHIKALIHNTDRNKVEVWFSSSTFDDVPLYISGADARKLGWQFRSENEDGLLSRAINEAIEEDNPSQWSDYSR